MLYLVVQPIFTRFDSLISMLPLGRQGINENSSQLGGIIGRDLNQVLAEMPGGFVQLAVHSKKEVAMKTIEELEKSQLQSIVRGHGSIVGEGADTGFILAKISEHPAPTRFAVIIKPRRSPIPAAKTTIIVEIEEEAYGKGWARLKEIPVTMLPPSQYAKDVYKVLADNQEHSSREIVNKLALFSKNECANGIRELLIRNVIIQSKAPQSYRLNPRRYQQCNIEYMDALKT